MPKQPLIVLSNTRFLSVVGLLLALSAVVVIVLLPSFSDTWCRQVEMPTYEARFGFRLESLEITAPGAAPYSVSAIAQVEPAGAFSGAGLRTGDVPRTNHGIVDFCNDLAAASDGEVVDLELMTATGLRAGRNESRRVRFQRRVE
jgi:hypothetical protein